MRLDPLLQLRKVLGMEMEAVQLQILWHQSEVVKHGQPHEA